MYQLMQDASTLFDYALECIGDVATTVASTPILLAGALVSIAFIGVGLFKRLLSTTI